MVVSFSISASFTVKFGLALALTQKKMLFLRGFILKPTEITYVLLKNGTKDF